MKKKISNSRFQIPELHDSKIRRSDILGGHGGYANGSSSGTSISGERTEINGCGSVEDAG
jgi:hypothetical protein